MFLRATGVFRLCMWRIAPTFGTHYALSLKKKLLGDYAQSSFCDYNESILSILEVNSRVCCIKRLYDALSGSFFCFDKYDCKFVSIKSMIQLGKIRILGQDSHAFVHCEFCYLLVRRTSEVDIG